MKKAVKNIPKKKINAVKELVNLIDTKKTILIADIGNIPGSQFQQISKKLRGKALVKVPKKNLLFRALDESKNEVVKKLKDHFKNAAALLFSDLDSYTLAGEILKIKSPSKAKTGQIAPNDLEIPAGPTELVPGPAISELGALGIQIMIKGGKIEIKDPRIVAKEGEAISQKAADMLGKLGIMPFTIGFKPVSAFDAKDNVIYVEMKIDVEEAKASLSDSAARALAFAVSIGLVNSETVKIMIQKAGGHEAKLIRTINGEPEPEVMETPAAPEETAAPAGETKPEKKEKPADANFAAGFF